MQHPFTGIMDKDGMLPQIPCKNCGTLLDDGTYGRAFELYAGCFTGLCGRCSQAEPYLVETEALDGAEWWSHPPANPSYRRQRQKFIYYSECNNCIKGANRKYSNWSYYDEYCNDCTNRYYEHPIRKRLATFKKNIYKLANNIYNLTHEEKKYKKYLKRYKNISDKVRKRQTKENLLARYYKSKETYERLEAKLLNKQLKNFVDNKPTT